MENNYNTIPKIRYTKFNEEWTSCKLKDVLKEYNEQCEKNGSYEHVSLTKEGVVPKSARYDRDSLVQHDDKKYRVTHLNDICYNPANLKFGVICRNSYKDGIFSPIYVTLRVLNNNYPKFIEHYVKNDLFIKRALSKQEGTVYERMSVKSQDLLDMDVNIPSFQEQKFIGNYLSDLDLLIEKQQNKYGTLVNMRSSLIFKLFPKNNLKIPEIRFKEFSNEWSEKRLMDIATMHARIGWQNLRTSEFLDHGKYMLITGTDFDEGKINYSTCHYVEKTRYDQDKNIQLCNGSILVTKDGTLGKVAIIKELPKPATLNAGVFNVLPIDKSITDNDYLFQYLKAPFLLDYVSKRATGGTIKHLNQNILVNFPVLIPQAEEQKKIGNLLNKMDELISLQLLKIGKLKDIKKAMVEKMIV